MTHIETLKDLIRTLHGAEATHRESVPVTYGGIPRQIPPTPGRTILTTPRTQSGMLPSCT
jgi:hypothetical protein